VGEEEEWNLHHMMLDWRNHLLKSFCAGVKWKWHANLPGRALEKEGEEWNPH
jgi:hypothetical protein